MHQERKIESRDEQSRRNGPAIASSRCSPIPRPVPFTGRDPFTLPALSFEGSFEGGLFGPSSSAVLDPPSDISDFKSEIFPCGSDSQTAPSAGLDLSFFTLDFASKFTQISNFLIDSALRLEIAATATKQRIDHVSNR
jgi:hypothetical protein